MRAAILVLMIGLAGCHATAPAFPHVDIAYPADGESDRDYLLRSAAKDFHAHGPEPARFRNVRFGYVVGAGHSQMALICGEVEPVKGAEAGTWIAFSTVKTSAYEQMLGGQGGFCARPVVVWEPEDLSVELLRRVEALR